MYLNLSILIIAALKAWGYPVVCRDRMTSFNIKESKNETSACKIGLKTTLFIILNSTSNEKMCEQSRLKNDRNKIYACKLTNEKLVSHSVASATQQSLWKIIRRNHSIGAFWVRFWPGRYGNRYKFFAITISHPCFLLWWWRIYENEGIIILIRLCQLVMCTELHDLPVIAFCSLLNLAWHSSISTNGGCFSTFFF